MSNMPISTRLSSDIVINFSQKPFIPDQRILATNESIEHVQTRSIFTGFPIYSPARTTIARICIIKVQLARRIMCQTGGGEEGRREREYRSRSCTTGNVEYVFVSGVAANVVRSTGDQLNIGRKTTRETIERGEYETGISIRRSTKIRSRRRCWKIRRTRGRIRKGGRFKVEPSLKVFESRLEKSSTGKKDIG